MNVMQTEYTPTDEFTLKMLRFTIQDFACRYEENFEVTKQLRNAYDNRMRSKNLLVYYMDSLISKNVRTKGTQTETSIHPKTNEIVCKSETKSLRS